MELNQILLMETVYALLVVVSCLLIFFRTRKIYLFSRHKGVRYFSYAFLFLAIGFMIRYSVMMTKLWQGNLMETINQFGLMTAAMEFFMILPGFFLLTSLNWKKFDKYFYGFVLAAFFIAVADLIFQSMLLMYLSQVTVFFFAALLSYDKSRKRGKYMKLFSVSIILFLIVWLVNMIAQYTIGSFPMVRIYTYAITLVACFIFVYITMKLTKDF